MGARKTLGPYTLVQTLAVGGMAELLLATKAFGQAEKRVVIKRMLPEIAKDERFRRMWRYYLLSCAGAFASRSIQLWQLVLSKGGVVGGYEAPR